VLGVASRALGHEREQWFELLMLVAISGHIAIWQILQEDVLGRFVCHAWRDIWLKATIWMEFVEIIWGVDK